MSRRVAFTVDDTRGAEIEVYARDHGYSSAADFARVATLRIMRMYPLRKAGSTSNAAEGDLASPGVPHTRQNATSEEEGHRCRYAIAALLPGASTSKKLP